MRRTWLSAAAIRLHLTAVVVIGGCIALGWWQLSRALAGNGLSWVYTFEWPLFAAYGLFMWWRLLHEAARDAHAAEMAAVSGESPAPRIHAAASPAVAARVDDLDFDPYDDADPDLAAYNRYLATLHASDRSRPWRKSAPLA